MIFDLERYIDEPLVYFDDKRKIDDQKLFLLGMRMRSDIVDLLLKGVKADEIIIKKLDPSENQSFALINMVAESSLSDWGFRLAEPAEIKEMPLGFEADLLQNGEARLLKKTVANFKMSDSKLREGEVIRALQEDFDAISDQLNNELNVFPQPMREMIMMTLLDRFHTWEKYDWDAPALN